MRAPALIVLLAAAAGSGAVESPHGAIALECTTCHTTTAWTLRVGAAFDHARDSAWPLEGQHRDVACGVCHIDLKFAGSPTSCAGCHLDVHQGSLGPACEDCHSPARWLDLPALTRRHDQSGFPLIGAHRDAACSACHTGSGAWQFTGTPLDCAACHLPDWQATSRPPHEESGLGRDCATCHGARRWTDTPGFAHAAFPLRGAHAAASCLTCHAGGQYSGLPTECWGCHEPAYRATTNPDHELSQFGQDCRACHGESAWSPSTFDHAGTDFPLTGAHAAISCASCHVDGQYQGTPADCWSCHQADYVQAINPDHQAGQYPQDCAVCHTTSAWQPASFNHNSTDFPLTGAHVTIACAACHVSGQYSGTPTDCLSCHEGDYQAATDPDHTAAGFPTDCAACHSTSRWDGATFNHDQQWFPIYSGQHQGEWSSCAECHTNSSDYAVFSCLTCHEHARSSTDSDHGDVSGYVYESQACLDCHPNGGSNDAAHPGLRTRGMDMRWRTPLR